MFVQFLLMTTIGLAGASKFIYIKLCSGVLSTTIDVNSRIFGV